MQRVKVDAVLSDKRVRRKLNEKAREAVIPLKKNCFEPSNYVNIFINSVT
ncbi:hypothetical protein P618_200497 [Holospora obtusa F1]|uniref:Uncharacterized protein n=1 Tax=Holospora obtusa F1 TaxID=1399147 RepID=W6TE00_HOLOB|nr:hypothetical protein [Holospora obtusa]ETZ07313.1 hypothetical protein P618_200497 [Holospora obtusa F1]